MHDVPLKHSNSECSLGTKLNLAILKVFSLSLSELSNQAIQMALQKTSAYQ